MNHRKKQLPTKKKLRGRPWPKGISGNPCGRPRGSLNKITLAVQEGFRPPILDKDKPHESWSDCFIQNGMKFRKSTLERVNPKGPVPIQPEMLDAKEFHREILWQGQLYFIQKGWVFDRRTRMAVKI